MGSSLQEQLLKAGLVDEKQVRRTQTRKRPPKRGKKGSKPAPSESAQAAREAMAQKAARDRSLNDWRKEKAERKAIRAQIRQMIEQNLLSRDDADLTYNFVDAGRVCRLYVTPAIRDGLINDRLAIVKLDDRYEVVPQVTAEKIRGRDARCVVTLETQATSEDEAYAEHPIPDDLMW
jgi:uncharacterized protein YaiL (DUF2058 family)